MIWSYQLAFTGFLSKSFSKNCWESLEEESIFRKPQAYEYICWGFLLISWYSNVKQPLQVQFLGISRITSLITKLDVCIAIKCNIKKQNKSFSCEWDVIIDRGVLTPCRTSKMKLSAVNYFWKIYRVLNMALISLFKVNDNNNAGVHRLNQIMFKLLILNQSLQLSCLQIEQLLVNC